MSTHTMARDTDTTRVQLRESGKHGLRQFFGNVAIHVVAGIVGSFGSINVESSAGTKVVGIIFTLNVESTLMGLIISSDDFRMG